MNLSKPVSFANSKEVWVMALIPPLTKEDSEVHKEGHI